MRTFATPDEILTAVGDELGPSDWVVVDQNRIDRFAEATGDHQWIHVDPQRAKDGPYGGTIAHGYLTLALLPELIGTLYRVEDGVALGLNYGLNRVRLTAPVPAGARVRATTVISEAKEVEGGVQVVFATTVELEDSSRPACLAESIVRLVRST